MSLRVQAALAAFAVTALGASTARADPLGSERPLRIEYHASAACPSADVFFEEIRWRTRLARLAAADEPALQVTAEIVRRGVVHHGQLVLGEGRERIVRGIDGESCDEVVSALALVTALGIDPHASMAAKPPPRPPEEPPAPPAPPEPPPEPPPAPPVVPPSPPPPAIEKPPAPAKPPWLLGARVVADLAVTPHVLFGGGAFAERRFDAGWRPLLRLALDAGATGSFDDGPGGVSFWRVIGRVQACGFEARPTASFSLAPCIEIQGGALHAEGALRGSLTFVRETTILWLGAGFAPRAGLNLGPVALDLQGGPILPWNHHQFVFQTPNYAIYTVPWVTWTVGLGIGGRIP